MARARVRAASGQWLLVHGSALGDGPGAPMAVILEPARPHELAPLIADAYGLSDRERAVTQYVAQGHSTAAIASLLHISPWTVQAREVLPGTDASMAPGFAHRRSMITWP
jgi:hypothetical protein